MVAYVEREGIMNGFGGVIFVFSYFVIFFQRSWLGQVESLG